MLLVGIIGKLITNSSCNKGWSTGFVPPGSAHKRARKRQESDSNIVQQEEYFETARTRVAGSCVSINKFPLI